MACRRPGLQAVGCAAAGQPQAAEGQQPAAGAAPEGRERGDVPGRRAQRLITGLQQQVGGLRNSRADTQELGRIVAAGSGPYGGMGGLQLRCADMGSWPPPTACCVPPTASGRIGCTPGSMRLHSCVHDGLPHTLPIADSTTQGRCSGKLHTISATSIMRSAEATEEPPNCVRGRGMADREGRVLGNSQRSRRADGCLSSCKAITIHACCLPPHLVHNGDLQGVKHRKQYEVRD